MVSLTPNNLNFLPTNNFQFGLRRAPTMNFFCQEANLPGISLDPAKTDNPLVSSPWAGDHLVYEELMIKFGVDEKMLNFLEIWNWLRGLGFSKESQEYANLAANPMATGQSVSSDAELIVFDSAKVAKFSIIYTDLVPTGISGIKFSTSENDVQYAYATASFRYTYYDINSLV